MEAAAERERGQDQSSQNKAAEMLGGGRRRGAGFCTFSGKRLGAQGAPTGVAPQGGDAPAGSRGGTQQLGLGGQGLNGPAQACCPPWRALLTFPRSQPARPRPACPACPQAVPPRGAPRAGGERPRQPGARPAAPLGRTQASARRARSPSSLQEPSLAPSWPFY